MKPISKVILNDIIDYCGCTGLMLKESKSEKEYFKSIHAPISLFPVSVPEPYFTHAINVQPLMNILIEKLARDAKTIHDTLKPFADHDEFPKRLMQVSAKYHSTKNKQDVYLGIVRSDYMLDCMQKKLQMVEYNTIASSFGVLSDKLNSLQRYMYKKYPYLFPSDFDLSKLAPSNEFVENATKAFNLCIELYKKSTKKSHSSPHIAVIIQEGERNVFDQKPLEIASFEKYGIPSMRVTFKQVFDLGRVDPETNILTIDGKEIGLVYYRAGYTPNDYPSEDEWKAREMLECSLAIKCPSIDLHLTTFKTFQEHFGRKGFLENYLEVTDLPKIRAFLSGFWSLMDRTAETEKIVEKAISHPESYVLKSHREGGGNNFYNEELRKMLQNGQKDWSILTNLFLMEKITTPETPAHLLRNGELLYANTVSEYSRYGIFISSQEKLMLNIDGGHLVRTKKSDVGEGGVATGFAVINIPYKAGNCEEKDGKIILKEI